jgi:hypothetical protein
MSGRDRARVVVLEALTSSTYGRFDDVAVGERSLDWPLCESVASLGLDSLAVMEFCISVELQSGLELTPDLLDSLGTLEEVVNWIAERI